MSDVLPLKLMLLIVIHCLKMLTEWWLVNAIEWKLGSSENSAIYENGVNKGMGE